MEHTVTLRELKETLRHPFAWPGGYSIALYAVDGEQICRACVRANFRAVCAEHLSPERWDQWRIVAIGIRWEGPANACAHCGAELPSEHGDPSADEPGDAS